LTALQPKHFIAMIADTVLSAREPFGCAKVIGAAPSLLSGRYAGWSASVVPQQKTAPGLRVDSSDGFPEIDHSTVNYACHEANLHQHSSSGARARATTKEPLTCV